MKWLFFSDTLSFLQCPLSSSILKFSALLSQRSQSSRLTVAVARQQLTPTRMHINTYITAVQSMKHINSCEMMRQDMKMPLFNGIFVSCFVRPHKKYSGYMWNSEGKPKKKSWSIKCNRRCQKTNIRPHCVIFNETKTTVTSLERNFGRLFSSLRFVGICLCTAHPSTLFQFGLVLNTFIHFRCIFISHFEIIVWLHHHFSASMDRWPYVCNREATEKIDVLLATLPDKLSLFIISLMFIKFLI